MPIHIFSWDNTEESKLWQSIKYSVFNSYNRSILLSPLKDSKHSHQSVKGSNNGEYTQVKKSIVSTLSAALMLAQTIRIPPVDMMHCIFVLITWIQVSEN